MTQIAAALFAWDAVEARSDLERFFLVRDHLPDRDLIAALEAKRGLGRDDYPVIPMWTARIAGVVFQHQTPGSLAQVNFYQRRQNIIKSKQIHSESRKKPPLLAKCLRF